LQLQAQADVGISDQSGMSPLHYACQRLHAQLVPLLLQQSASPNAKDTTNERTPLHYATNHNAPSVAMVIFFIHLVYFY
jgi:ankyrin repeat protein